MVLYDELRDCLRATGSTLVVMSEVSVALGERDAPEPDLTLTSEPDGAGLIPVASVALIVEVADTTLQSDLTRKALIYARGGVPEYWVADVNGRVIHKVWAACENGYQQRDEVAFGTQVTAVTIDCLTIDTKAL